MRKVFILVFVMLAFTVGVAAVFLFVDPVREYVAGYDVPCASAFSESQRTVYQRSDGSCFVQGDGRWMFYTSWALTFVCLIALSCSEGLRRRVPWNYAALVLFTAVMSVQVGCICAYWNLSVVLIAFAVTGAAVVGITLGAILLPWDMTKRGNALGMVSLVVFFVALATFLVAFLLGEHLVVVGPERGHRVAVRGLALVRHSDDRRKGPEPNEPRRVHFRRIVSVLGHCHHVP